MALLHKQLSTEFEKQLEDLSPDQVLIDPGPEDILELDERWSLVNSKVNTAWLGFAIGRRSQQLVGWHVGKRDPVSANYFLVEIPSQDSICHSRSDPCIVRSVGHRRNIGLAKKGLVKPVRLKALTI